MRNSSHFDDDLNKESGDDNHNFPLVDEIFINNPEQSKMPINTRNEGSVVSTKLTKEKKDLNVEVCNKAKVKDEFKITDKSQTCQSSLEKDLESNQEPPKKRHYLNQKRKDEEEKTKIKLIRKP